MRTRFIRSSEKRRIEESLTNQFGISKLPYLLFQTGKEKIRAYSGNLSKEEIAILARIANIEIIGLYILKEEQDYRINFDATQLFKDQINSGVIEINEQEYQKWIRGYDIEKITPKGTIILKYKEDLVGSGKSNGEKIFNYIPKDRRLKKPLPQNE